MRSITLRLMTAAVLVTAVLAAQPAAASSAPAASARSLPAGLLEAAWEPLARLWQSVVDLLPGGAPAPRHGTARATPQARCNGTVTPGANGAGGAQPDEGATPDPNG